MDGTAREDLRGDTEARGEDAASLVEAALQLRWRAPELALSLADRAAANGTTIDQHTALLAAASLNRLGRGVEAGVRALAGLRHVGPGSTRGDLEQQLRVELAAGAAAVGASGAALAALRPVLEPGSGTTPAVRAAALVQLAALLSGLGQAAGAAGALSEADDLYQGDTELEPVAAVLLRGTVATVRAAHHRRHGEPGAAEAAAQHGLELLSALPAPAHDGVGIDSRLTLEKVLALLDRAELSAAMRAAEAVVGSSVRAAAAPWRGWLHLALATRVHLPEGRHREALALLGDAVDAAERHALDPVLAECLEGLCQVHEERGEYHEALRCLRSAHAAEYRHRRAADGLRIELLEEYGTGRGLADQLAGLIGNERDRPRRSRTAGLLDPAGFLERAEVVLAGTNPGRAISVAVIAVDGSGSLVGSADAQSPVEALAGQLRKVAPARGVVGRLDSGRFAVLLPGADRAAALDWSQRLRAAVAADSSGPSADRSVTISVGVAEHDTGAGAGELLAAADRDLATARGDGHDEVTTVSTVPAPPVHEIAVADLVADDRIDDIGSAEHGAEPEAGGRRARHRRDGGQQRPVAELLSAAGRTSRGGPGRRRAEDRPDVSGADPADPADPADVDRTPVPATLVSEPPLGAPQLVDGSLDSTTFADRIGVDHSREAGLGDLLAEALAAFEQGRRSRDTGAEAAGGGDSSPPSTSADSPTEPMSPVGATGSGWDGPDLVGEQAWQPPGAHRRWAVGD